MSVPQPGTVLNGLHYLKGLVHLTALNLSQVDLRDDELLSFLPFLTALTWLHLKFSPQLLSRAVSRALSPLRALRHLNLDHCEQLDDEILSTVCSLTALTSLDLSYIPRLTSNALASLRSLQRLTELNINGDRINDRALSCLSSMNRLASLRIDGSLLSDVGLRALHELHEAYGTRVCVGKTFLQDNKMGGESKDRKRDRRKRAGGVKEFLVIGHPTS